MIAILTLLTAWSGSAEPGVPAGALPFPHAGLVVDGHLALDPGDFETPYDGTPVDTEHVAWRTGFSRVQTTVFQPDQALDPAFLPGQAEGTATGSVQLWDLTAGAAQPCFAEVDLYPDNDEVPTLLVRPLVPLAVGHRVAVVVTTGVRTSDGEPLAPVGGWAAAAARQVLYAASKLFWDLADPAGFVEDLVDRSVLWQLSIGDEQVPNLTTELLARGVGVTLMTPSASVPFGLETGESVTGPALVQFDPEVPLPAAGNRPAESSGAHGAPRLWDGTTAQSLRFLDADDPGVILHPCGVGVCSASNPGSL